MKKLFFVVLVVIAMFLSGLFLWGYTIYDDVLRLGDSSTGTPLDSLFYIVRVRIGGDDTITIIDTLWNYTIYADSNFKVQSTYINMGAVSTNINTGLISFVAGFNDTILGDYNVISGGRANKCDSIYATIGGGWRNKVTGERSTIGGGDNNQVMREDGTIGGGNTNKITSQDATIAGGHSNVVSGAYGSVGGGGVDSVSGGWGCIPGGNNNTVEQKYGFAFGNFAKVRGDITDTLSILFGRGTIDSVSHGFLIGDEATDILDRSHTFKCGLDTNVFVGQVECSADVWVGDVATFSGSGASVVIDDGELNTTDSTQHHDLIYMNEWKGGAFVASASGNNETYVTTGVDDNLYCRFGLPYKKAGGTVVLDTVRMDLYTQGNEDSVQIYFLKYNHGNEGSVVTTSWLEGGSSGWASTGNMLSSDYTVQDSYGYGFYFDCENNGANDILLELFVNVIYHLE